MMRALTLGILGLWASVAGGAGASAWADIPPDPQPAQQVAGFNWVATGGVGLAMAGLVLLVLWLRRRGTS